MKQLSKEDALWRMRAQLKSLSGREREVQETLIHMVETGEVEASEDSITGELSFRMSTEGT